MATVAKVIILCTLLVCAVSDCPFRFRSGDNEFEIELDGVKILQHSVEKPLLFVGNGETSFTEFHGSFDVKDYVTERIALSNLIIHSDGSVIFSKGSIHISLTFGCDDENPLIVDFGNLPAGFDRVWFRVLAADGEHVYGGGEQFTYFDLKGHVFPIWTREQGVGRDKRTLQTFMADVHGPDAGGDYHTTYFPQSTFLSSRGFFCHVADYDYIELDFRHAHFHEIFQLGQPSRIYFQTGTPSSLVTKLTDLIGRPAPLASWVSDGVILGIQGGTDIMLEHLRRAQKHGIHVAALWIQDWSGKINTKFGQRVFWDWKWDEERYPRLREVAKQLKEEENIRILGYANANLNSKGDLYKEADKKGYFAKDKNGNTLTTDFMEFDCGFVDFTNPEAYDWYKETILKTNMLKLGLSGWMADFGEYLPTDAIFADGRTGQDMHNEYPVLWARMNYEAVQEMGMLGDAMFFMRAGGAGTSKYSTMMWAGDQNVDFSVSDGLASTIPAALSMGMSGMGLTHYDIGGYTTITELGMVRSEELFLRGAEVAVFTPVMRTHEGNKPKDNWQVYSSVECMRKFARMVNAFRALRPYRKAIVQEVSETGLPAQRPLLMHYPNDAESWTTAYQYLFGQDILVAPVTEENATKKKVFFPSDSWVDFFDEKIKYKGPVTLEIDAPLGRPPVFYREGSEWMDTFLSAAAEFNKAIEIDEETLEMDKTDPDVEKKAQKQEKKMKSEL